MDGFVEENCRWHPRTTAPRLAARFSAFAALDEGGERPAGSRGRLTVAQWLATLREGGREGGPDRNLCFSRQTDPSALLSREVVEGENARLSFSLSLSLARARVHIVNPHLFARRASISHQITVAWRVGPAIDALDM